VFCAKTENDTGTARDDTAAADLRDIVVGRRGNRQRLRLEVVDDQHVLKPKAREHILRPDDPAGVRQRNFVALDRAGDGKDRRTRLHGRLVEDALLHRLLDRLETAGLDRRKLPRLGIGIHKQCEAGIRAADIADQ
jgi:hypothetical protein